MDSIEALRLIELDASHVAGGVALSAEAHWNQNAADWALMLDCGTAIGYQSPDGELVGSALILPYGEEFAWISMVLVTASWRRKGLATRLLQKCITMLEDRGLAQILDATPAGALVYGPLGFVTQFEMQRWEAAEVSIAAPQIPLSRPFEPADLQTVLDYDLAVFGGDRGGILRGMAPRSADCARIANAGNGYLFSRDGRRAHQIGPVCADDAGTAVDMLAHALSHISGPVFIDVPDMHDEVVAFLKAHGFETQRPFTRMYRGSPAGFGDPSRMFAVAGPELG
jgi:GNAT superfamily N-acetyltransferase